MNWKNAAVTAECDIEKIVVEQGLMTAEEFQQAISPENVIKLGSNHIVPPQNQNEFCPL